MLTKEVIGKLSELYDEYYNKADILLRNNPICKFKDGKCILGNPNGCCGNKWDLVTGKQLPESSCINHMIDKGCIVKCIRCKFFLCYNIRMQYIELHKGLTKLHDEFHTKYLDIYPEEEPFPHYYQSKEVWLHNLHKKLNSKKRLGG